MDEIKIDEIIEDKRCMGLTRKGTRCQKKASLESKFCYQHKEQNNLSFEQDENNAYAAFCRYCGTGLEKYNGVCPYCETNYKAPEDKYLFMPVSPEPIKLKPKKKSIRRKMIEFILENRIEIYAVLFIIGIIALIIYLASYPFVLPKLDTVSDDEFLGMIVPLFLIVSFISLCYLDA